MKKLSNYLISNIEQLEREILDFDLLQLIENIDNCHSKLGKQFLCYKVLASIRHGTTFYKVKDFPLNIDNLNKYKQCLKKLNKDYHLDFIDIVLGNETIKSHWTFKYSRFLLFLIIIGLIGFKFSPLISTILLTVLLIINVFIFFVSKGIIINSKYYFLNLLDFSKTCSDIKNIDKTFCFESRNKHYGFLLKVLTFEDKIENYTPVGFMASSMVEVVKAVFLIDSLIIDFLRSKVEIDKEKLLNDFFLIAYLDFKLSTNTLYHKKKNLVCKPVFNSGEKLVFEDLTHPLIQDCIVNSISIEKEVIMVSGSNLAGKSTFLKSIAINIILARSIGLCFAKSALINNFNIFSSFKISDDLIHSKSFFNTELDVIKNIIESIDDKSVIFLDEPFKGTNSEERLALNISVLKYFHRKKCKILFTTHDVKLFDYIRKITTPYHFNLNAFDDKVFFDYKLKKGIIENYYAIEILKDMKFPKSIINDSINIVQSLRDEN